MTTSSERQRDRERLKQAEEKSNAAAGLMCEYNRVVDMLRKAEAERDAWEATANHHYKEAFQLRAERDAALALLREARHRMSPAQEPGMEFDAGAAMLRYQALVSRIDELLAAEKEGQ